MARRALPSALALLALAACSRGDDTARNAGGTNAAIEDNVSAPPDEGNAQTPPAGETAPMAGALIPPAPGEPGGLPDDRAPLDESAQKNPRNVAAAGLTAEQWALALEERRYGDAYRMWRGEGAASGMSAAAFAESYRKYSEIHVQVGRPAPGGSADAARVPVQLYGRLAASGQPFNLIGALTLARTPDGRRPWLISGSDLKVAGMVRIAGEETSANAIPAAYRGAWQTARANCGDRRDTMGLTVTPASLLFYESEGKVTKVTRDGADAIVVSADYTGEGERWTRSTRLVLGEDGRTLVAGGVKRVRCD